MTLALLKLSDVLLRALYVLTALYVLEPRSAGQFGLFTTLVGLYAFAIGFEYYRVLQHRLAGAGKSRAAALLEGLVPFVCANYIVLLPIFSALILFWLQFTAFQVVAALVIVAAEYLCNEVYRVAVVSDKYRHLLLIAVIRSGMSAGALAIAIAIQGHELGLATVILIWAATSAIGFLAIIVAYGVLRSGPIATVDWTFAALRNHYRVSIIYFLVGLAAILSAQADRIVVGAVGGFETAGLYFKNLFLAAAVYQASTILFHNRTIQQLFKIAANASASVMSFLGKQTLQLTTFYSVVAAFFWVAEYTVGQGMGFEAQSPIRAEYLSGLLFACLLRSVADYAASFLVAQNGGAAILRAHCWAIVVTIALNLVLLGRLGIQGAMLAAIGGSGVLLAASIYSLRQMSRRAQP